MENTMDGPLVGIDLGTTNSAIALIEDGEFRIVPNENGEVTTSSVVAYDGEHAIVGSEALDRARQYPDQTVVSVKRLMGTEDVVLGGQREFTPEEVTALVLKQLKRDAERELDREIERAVITVPAQFTSRQRRATMDAGEIAGLRVDRIINDPTAACLANGVQTGTTGTVVVYDLGGGTFDASLIDVTDGVFEVIATVGDTHLGGDDWDETIVEWLAEQIEYTHGIRLEDDPIAVERLFDAARTAKHELSSRTTTTITLPFLTHRNASYDIKHRLHRETFERLSRDLVDQTIALCETLLSEAGYRPDQIDEILLVGGSTRMPHVHDRITAFFGQEPVEDIDPVEIVPRGATAQAALIHGEPIPIQPDEDEDEREPVEPEEVVVLDVVPHALCVNTTGTETNEPTEHTAATDRVLIPTNAAVPARATHTVTTTYDWQRYVRIRVSNGERTAQDNTYEEYRIGPIRPRPAGETTIEVGFELDRNAIVHTSAVDTDRAGTTVIIESMANTRTELDSMKRNLPHIR